MATLIDKIQDSETLYRVILTKIFHEGEVISPRGMRTKALHNVTIVIPDPTNVLLTGTGRGLSVGLLAMEPLQLVGGFSDPTALVSVVPHYANFLDEGRFWGAYGVRSASQVGLVAERLRQDPNTRQARITFWDYRLDLAHEGKHDYPCTTGAEFRVDSNGRLHGTTFMRSNDAWLGYPYDIVQHAALLKSLATFLHFEVGTYTHVVTNLHLYEKNWAEAEKLLSSWTRVKHERLAGGIGTGTEKNWSEVQDRARKIFYSPHDVDPVSSEEAYYQQAMIKESEKINVTR